MDADSELRYAAPDVAALYAAALARCAEGQTPLDDPGDGAVAFIRCDTQPDGGTPT